MFTFRPPALRFLRDDPDGDLQCEPRRHSSKAFRKTRPLPETVASLGREERDNA
jgi:hypothetical protein